MPPTLPSPTLTRSPAIRSWQHPPQRRNAHPQQTIIEKGREVLPPGSGLHRTQEGSAAAHPHISECSSHNITPNDAIHHRMRGLDVVRKTKHSESKAIAFAGPETNLCECDDAILAVFSRADSRPRSLFQSSISACSIFVLCQQVRVVVEPQHTSHHLHPMPIISACCLPSPVCPPHDKATLLTISQLLSTPTCVSLR